jgi:hypothetical protein
MEEKVQLTAEEIEGALLSLLEQVKGLLEQVEDGKLKTELDYALSMMLDLEEHFEKNCI